MPNIQETNMEYYSRKPCLQIRKLGGRLNIADWRKYIFPGMVVAGDFPDAFPGMILPDGHVLGQIKAVRTGSYFDIGMANSEMRGFTMSQGLSPTFLNVISYNL